MKRSICSLLLIAAMTSVGCLGTPADPSEEGSATAVTAPSRDLSAYSGEELYAGILYGDGPAAGLVPSVASYIDASIQVSAEHHRQIQSLVADVAAANPDFFEGFARDVRSGDRIAIREALNRASKLTSEALHRTHAATVEAKMSDGRTDSDDTSSLAGTWFFVEGYVAVAVVLLVVISAIDTTPIVGAPESALILDSVSDDLAALTGN